METQGGRRARHNAPAIVARREAILRAADLLLGAAGLEGLTIRAILGATDLSRRAFYEVFATKDDLMLALFDHTLAHAARRLAIEAGDEASPADRMALVIRSIVGADAGSATRDLVRSDRRGAAFSREHLRLALVRPEDLQAAVDPLIGLISEIIEEGVKAGDWRSENPARAARFVYNLVSTTVHVELLRAGAERRSPAERRVLAEELTRFSVHALRA